MLSKKKISGAVAALMLAAPAMGADYGIGISFDRNSEKVYFPIRMSPTFLIEPALEWYRQDTDQTSSSGTALANDYRSLSLDIGLFAVRRVAENLDTRLGARLGYRKYEGHATYPSSSSGYVIAPTIGVEYFLHKQISVGAEVGYSYYSSDSQAESPGLTTYTDQTNSGTFTDITLRFYFP